MVGPSGVLALRRPPGEGHGAAEEPKLPPADDVVARALVGCALAALQLALEGAILGWGGTLLGCFWLPRGG